MMRGTPYPDPARRWALRWGWLLSALAVATCLLTYNGRWRPGRDSALYRAVGHSVASGNGYQYRGEAERLVHPGYPLLLAGCELLEGHEPERPQLTLAVMLLLSLASLLAVYMLIAERLSRWLAIVATTMVALSPEFVEHVSELRPDSLFLGASCTALLGFARLRHQRSSTATASALLLLGAGSIVAWALRPTFWFLAAAIVAAAVSSHQVRAAMGARRWLAIGSMAAVCVMALALDPRIAGLDPSAGGYEQAVWHKLSNPQISYIKGNVARLLETVLPRAVLGTTPHPVPGTLMSIVIIASLFYCVDATWRWYGAITLLGTAAVGINPRYYLPLLPFIFVGFTLGSARLVRAIRAARIRTRLRAGLMIAACATLAAGSATLILEQHGVLASIPDHARYLRIAGVVREHTSDASRILTVEPRLVSYLAQRRAYGPWELPAAVPGSRPTHALFDPASSSSRRFRAFVELSGLHWRIVTASQGMVLARIVYPGRFGPPPRTSKKTPRPNARPPSRKNAIP